MLSKQPPWIRQRRWLCGLIEHRERNVTNGGKYLSLPGIGRHSLKQLLGGRSISEAYYPALERNSAPAFTYHAP
jgi:hypothetical protein